MRTYTRRFGAVSRADAGEAVLFTASDLYVWILRDLVLTNQASAAGLLQVFIRAGSADHILYVAPSVAGVTSVHLELRQEILPSEQLVAYSAVGPFNCIATGYALVP